MLTPRQIEQRRNAGLALKDQQADDYYSTIGKKGGRPTFNEWLQKANERELALKAAHRPGRKRKENAIL